MTQVSHDQREAPTNSHKHVVMATNCPRTRRRHSTALLNLIGLLVHDHNIVLRQMINAVFLFFFVAVDVDEDIGHCGGRKGKPDGR